MILQAKETEVDPETKIAYSIIADKQGLKSRTAYHYAAQSAGPQDSASIRSSLRSKNFVVHPDQDKDIKPLGLYEPHKGISRAHQLSYQDHVRIQQIKNEQQDRNKMINADESRNGIKLHMLTGPEQILENSKEFELDFMEFDKNRLANLSPFDGRND